MSERITILVDHTKTEYVCYWKRFQVYSAFDEISGKPFLIRSSEQSFFSVDRMVKRRCCLYWIYYDQIFREWKTEQYFVTPREKKYYGQKLYNKATRLPEKRQLEFKLKYPEFFI